MLVYLSRARKSESFRGQTLGYIPFYLLFNIDVNILPARILRLSYIIQQYISNDVPRMFLSAAIL